MSRRTREALAGISTPSINRETTNGATPTLGYASNLNSDNVQRIMQSADYLQDLADYYYERDGKSFANSDEMIDYARSDRRWRNFNTISIGRDIYDANTMSDEQTARMARIQAVYDASPSFFEDGGDGWAGFGEVAAATIADPINLIGFGSGGAAAKASAAAVTRSGLARGLGADMVRREATRAGLSAGVRAGAKGEAIVGGIVEGVHDQAIQRRNVEIGLQDDVSYMQTAGAVAAGGVLSGALGGAFGAMGAVNPLRRGGRTNIGEGMIQGAEMARADATEIRRDMNQMDIESGEADLPARGTPEEKVALTESIKARTQQMDQEFVDELDARLAERGEEFDIEADLFDVEVDEAALTQGQRINLAVDRMNDLQAAADVVTKQADELAAKADPEAAATQRTKAASLQAASDRIANQLRRIHNSKITTTDEVVADVEAAAVAAEPLLLEYDPNAPRMGQLPDGSPVRDLNQSEVSQKKAIIPELKVEGRPIKNEQTPEPELGRQEGEQPGTSREDVQVDGEQAVADAAPQAEEPQTELSLAEERVTQAKNNYQPLEDKVKSDFTAYKAARQSGQPASVLAPMYRKLLEQKPALQRAREEVKLAEQDVARLQEAAASVDGQTLDQVAQNASVDAAGRAPDGTVAQDQVAEAADFTPETVAETIDASGPAILEQLSVFSDMGLAQPKKYYERVLKSFGDGRRADVKVKRREFLLGELQRAVASYQLVENLEAATAGNPDNVFQIAYHRADIQLSSDDPQIVQYVDDMYSRILDREAKNLFLDRFATRTYTDAMDTIREEFGEEVAALVEAQVSPGAQRIGTPKQWSAMAKDFFSRMPAEQRKGFEQREATLTRKLVEEQGFSETEARALARERIEMAIDKAMRASDPLADDTRTLTDFSVSDADGDNARFMGSARRQGLGTYTAFGKEVKGGDALKKAQGILRKANRFGYTGQLLERGIKVTPDGRINQLTSSFTALQQIYQAQVDVATNRIVSDPVLAERNAAELEPVDNLLKEYQTLARKLKKAEKEYEKYTDGGVIPESADGGDMELGSAELETFIDNLFDTTVRPLREQLQQLDARARQTVDTVFFNDVDAAELGHGKKALQAKRKSLTQNTEKGAAGNRMEKALTDADMNTIKSEINALKTQLNRAVNNQKRTGKLGMSEERMEEIMSDIQRLTKTLENGGKGDKALRQRMKKNIRQEKIADAILRGEEPPTRDFAGDVEPEDVSAGRAQASEVKRKAAAEAKYSQRISEADLKNMSKAELIEFIRSNKSMLDAEINANKTPEVAPATTKHTPRVVQLGNLLVDVKNDFKYKKTSNNTFDVYLDGQKIGRGEKTDSGFIYDNGTDKFFHPNADDMLDALPRRHANMLQDLQKRKSMFDEATTGKAVKADEDFVHPDWRHTESYAEEVPVPASNKPDPIQDAAPPSDPNNPLTFTEADFDVPAGRQLAVQIIDPAAGKATGAVRVFSYKNKQTLGGVLASKSGMEYVVGSVEHGMTSSKMGARETFRPLNADDPFIPVNGNQPVKARDVGAEQLVSKRARINKPTTIEKLQERVLDNPPQWALDDNLVTVADLYGYIENLDKIDWARLKDVDTYRQFMQIRAEAGMLLNQYAPNGVSRPVASAKNSVSQLARILEGRADDEIQAAQDFIVRLAGHNRDKAPLFTHGAGDSLMQGMGNGTTPNGNRIQIGESSLTMDENGQRHIPVTATIIHEMGHWIYFNLLEEADKMRFWDAMGKYYGDTGVNVEMLRRRGSIGPGVATNDLESPGEFFANQFMAWAVNGGQVNNLPLWKKVARMASTLIRRLTGDDAIEFDADLIPIFQKYMPVLDVDPDSLVDNGGISRFAHLEQLGKEHGKSGGKTAALSGKMLADHDVQRTRMRTVLNTSTYETADALGLVTELQRVIKEVYGAYGGKQYTIKHPDFKQAGQGSTRVRLLDGTYELDRLMKAQYAIHDYLRTLREAGAVSDTKDGLRGSLTLSDESAGNIGRMISEQEVEFEGFSSWDAQMAQMLENNSSLNNLETKAVMHLHKLSNEMLFALDGAMEKHIQIFKRNMKKSARQEGVLVDLFDGTTSVTRPSQKSLYYMRKAKEEAKKEIDEYFGLEELQANANKTKFTDADASADPVLNESPSKMSAEELAAEAKGQATLGELKRVSDLGNEMQGRNNTRAKSVEELIDELDEQGREVYDAIRSDEETAQRVLRSAMEMTRSPETAAKGRIYMQIATKVLQDFGVDNPAKVKNTRVQKAVKRIQEKEVGTDNENGILHGASPALKEHTAGLTHRDKRTEYVMRNMFQRMAELQGVDENTPFTEYEATIILGFNPKGADDEVPLRTDSEMYNELRKHMRVMAQQLRSGDMAVFRNLGDMHYAGLSESERALFDEHGALVGISGQEFFNESHMDFLNGESIAISIDGRQPSTVKRIVQNQAEASVFVVNKLTDGEAFKSKPQFMAYGDIFASGRNVSPIIAAADSVSRSRLHPALAGKYAAELPSRMSERIDTAVREFLGLKPHESISSKVFFNGGYNGNRGVDGTVHVEEGDYGTGIYLKKADKLNKDYDPAEYKKELLAFLDETGTSGQAKIGANDAINMLISIRERLSRLSNAAGPAQRRVVQDLLRMEDRQWRILENISPIFGYYNNKVMPVFADMRNTFDFSKNARYSIVGNQRNNVAYLIDRMGANGMIRPEGIQYLRGVLTDEFTGLDLYKILTDEDVGILHKRGSAESATEARENLNLFLSEEGFDSLEIDDGFMVLHEGAVRHVKDGFTESSAKGHIQAYVNADQPMPVAQVAEEMAFSNGELPRGMGVGVIAEAQRLGMPDTISKPLRKIMRKDNLNEVDIDRVGVFSTVKNYFTENSNFFRSLGASWMGDILKPRKGFGIFEKHDVELNNILQPIFSDLLKLPDNTSGFNRWARRNEGLLLRDIRQPASHKRIISALREGRSAVQALNVEERRLALKIAKAFEAELNKMREMGIAVGDTRNYGLDYYVPQVWDKEAILSNPNKFKRALFRYLMNEQRDPNFEGQARSNKEIQGVVDTLFNRMTDTDGVLDTVDILRTSVSSPFQRRMLRLKPGDIKEMDEFLVNDLNGILAKYFDRTVRKRALTEKLGIGGHGLAAYKSVIREGKPAAVKILMSDKKMDIVNNTLQGVATVEQLAIPRLAGTTKDVEAIVGDVARHAQDGASGKSKAKMILINAMEPHNRENKQFLARVDAIVNAFADFPGGGANSKTIQHIDNITNVLNKRPIDGSSGTETKHKFTRNLKAFNSVSLLGFTTLTSIPDLALPLIRSGNMAAFARAWKNYSTDPSYRQAAKNIGVGIENLLHDRMVQMGGEGSQKFSNAFFNFTLLTPWTNFNREIAAMVGYEAFKSELARAVSMKQSGNVNSNAYRTAIRFLERYGLTGEGADYDFLAKGAFSLDTIPPNNLEIQDQLKAAILRFTNESIFTPNPNDIPMWAQTPWGGLMFQLKSFPLMMSRLSADVLREAGKGNVKPLVYMGTAGVGLGMFSIGLKDLVQSRGGEDGESRDFRERAASKLIPIEEGGDYDERLGWYLEGLMAMGGLGLFAELLYNTSAQLDNGKYGYVRAMSGIFGPAVSASEAAFDVAAGGADFITGDGEKTAKRRQALRQIASRVPVAGGVNSFREAAADLAGDPDSGGSNGGGNNPFSGSGVFSR